MADTADDERGRGPELPDVGQPESDETEADQREKARRRRLAAAFGEVLPDRTSDERDGGWGDREGGDGDDWLRRQKPPHHG